ncbi:MAG: hypothetical protein JST30_07890 [Armatimonadetes bacterium]|nr:hypothetical protein [Armatimonadota bacterium]
MKRTLALLALLTLQPAVLFAQDFDSGDSAKPWDSLKLPKKSVKLDFKGASVDAVIQYFSKASGITIIKDPSLTQPLTLSTANAVPLNEAFSILNTALGLRNYEIKKDGKVLVVKAKPQNNRGGRDMTGGASFDPSMLAGAGQDQSVLKVYRVNFANASTVARVVNDVFAGTGGGGPQFTMAPGGAFGNRGGRTQGRGFSFGGFGQQQTIRASSDDYSNTVIVNAPSKNQRQVEDLIKEIDTPAEEAQKPKVYRLEFATSDELQPVINNVLVANAPRGKGGSTSNTPVDRQFSGFPFGGLFGNRQNSNNSAVVSEPRTNSLIVTTTEGNHELVTKVLKDLDTEIKIQSTTFVLPLDNARADQVAQLMQQAFGTRTGANGRSNNTGRTSTQNGTQNRNNRNNNGGNRLGNGNQLGGNVGNEDTLALEVGEDGQLRTSIDVNSELMAQFFGGQFGGGGQNNQNRTNQNTGQTVGRDAQGRVVPVQDLTNQVTVIPDQNTNSLIIVTTPGNADLIRNIVAQLDRIPEQVMIETIIVEATLGSEDKLGVEWKFAQTPAFGNPGTGGTAEGNFGLQTANGQGFRYTLTGGNLTGFINALKTDTKFQVLSTPKIFTSNNVEAEINISQRVPYVTSQRTDVNGNITYTYDFEDVGIVLTVTPRITANGYVTMDVLQTANDLQGFTSFNAPIVNQRQAETTVAVKDGETIILGGIIRNTVTSTVKKIPLLGDIPILGNIFRSTDRSKNRTELLVFLSPRVVRNPDDAAKLRKNEQEKLSKSTQGDLKKVIDDGKGKKGGDSSSGDR